MKEVERQKIWEKYTKNPTQEMREQIIIEYAPLVKIVAGRLSMYLGGNVEYEDLVSYGVFGLIDAIDKFDTNKDVKFETYASLRIRGSILDQIRKMDWIPRTVRQRQRKIDEAIKSLEARTGKTPTDEMLAEELGVSGEELLSWQSQLKVTNVVSLYPHILYYCLCNFSQRNNLICCTCLSNGFWHSIYHTAFCILCDRMHLFMLL